NFANAFCGWNVDNVVVTNEECLPPCPPPAAFTPRIGSFGGESFPGNAGWGLNLTRAPPGSVALLVIGATNPLPPPAAAGCWLCSLPLLAPGPFPAPAGSLLPPLPLPPPPALIPCIPAFCAQWVIISPFGVFTSSAGKIRLQLG